MEKWKMNYLKSWLSGFKHPQSYGVHEQGWLGDFEDFLLFLEKCELGKYYNLQTCGGKLFHAKVKGHYVSMAEFFCTRQEYQNYEAQGKKPRPKFGKSRVLIWDFDKHADNVTGNPYEDMKKVYKYI